MFPVISLALRRRALKCRESRRAVATVISGSKLSQHVTERLKKDVAEMNRQLPGFRPGLVVLQVGDRDDSNLYISMKLKAAARIGINANHIRLPKTATQDEVLQSIQLYNEDPDVHGLIVQLPLDSIHPMSTEKVTNAVDPDKDVDGLCSVNAGKLARGDLQSCFIPCTPNGCMELLKHTGVSVSGKNAVVIGRSKIVGAPMHDLLLWNHATVTCCHSKTPDLPAEVKKADILVVGTGNAEMVKGEWIKDGAVVIDVGINYIPDSSRASGMRVVGDVHYPSAQERAGFITPVPGGVGPMTVAMLMENTVKSAARFLQTYRPGKWSVTYTKLKPQKPQPSDARISQCATRKPIHQLAKEIGLFSKEVEVYGRGGVRVSLDVLKRLDKQPDGKYVAVTGLTSSPLTEGRSIVTLGLAQALGGHLKVNAFACVRQPSLHHCLGVRGAAVGGGYSQISIEEARSLFTGDAEAVLAFSGLITDTITAYCHYQAKLSDQALFDVLVPVRDDHRAFSSSQLKRLQRLGVEKYDPSTLTQDEIRRLVRLDINPDVRTDRASLDGEIMAVVSLSRSVEDLQDRLARMVVAHSTSGEPIITEDLGISGVAGVLLKESLKPCLMQTLEGTPVFLHISPLADAAWGSPSIMADKMALKLVGPQGFVVAETPHCENFFSITCRSSGLRPHVLVIVTSVRALKMCGGGPRVTAGFPLPEQYSKQKVELLENGCAHLQRRLETARAYGVPVVLAVNTFSCDSEAEVEMVCDQARRFGAVEAVQCSSWSEGGAGALELAHGVQRAAEIQSMLHFPYELQMPVIDKMKKAAWQMCGAEDVELSAKAKEKLERYIKQGFGHYPVCISESRICMRNDAGVKVVPISDIQAYAGAGFLRFVPDMTNRREDPTWPRLLVDSHLESPVS
ncbi:C-1-tetrahydrofolate synthase, cytoplasmic [Ictalurus punctatus]|uniref:C-1-tetrahydrofolate synthase, cytoplasmic n=1 Tax=Ictalurus punctatus TaxID=7998 RepID=A0A2D0Q0Q0_ICTPU|nr:C-1-tetrahydrofolate synthase, cytoplasmic [Ictalurus punctatus]XP_017310956.1 C-1-tetrahydrofolate synthase, cytoplasmic [Ictalurus punctatus]XP_017310957.1 C-1-tetrahydrofolate synthase, cytoplasmic [Ictalurus punctatus]